MKARVIAVVIAIITVIVRYLFAYAFIYFLLTIFVEVNCRYYQGYNIFLWTIKMERVILGLIKYFV